jgi:Tfp pilus assembly protein PilF
LNLFPANYFLPVWLIFCFISGSWRSKPTQNPPASVHPRTHPAALVLQGLKDLQNGLLKPARVYLEQALETAAEMPDIHFCLGLLAEKMGDSGLARQHYLRTVQHYPRHAQAHVNLALLLSQTGALGQALG